MIFSPGARSGLTFLDQDAAAQKKKLRRKRIAQSKLLKQKQCAENRQQTRTLADDVSDGRGGIVHRTPLADVADPQDISFDVPNDVETRVREDGTQERWACIDGPHGAHWVPLPAGALPGQRVKHRLGPERTAKVTLPSDACEGRASTVQLPCGAAVSIEVPEGKRPGDTVEVSPPVVMVRIPRVASPGDIITFAMPGTSELRTARVPENVFAGDYFAVPKAGALERPSPTARASMAELPPNPDHSLRVFV